MMKKPVLSCHRLGNLFYTISLEWCRMGRWNSWFAVSSVGTNSWYIQQLTWSSHLIYSVIHCLVFGMILHSSWKLLVCFDVSVLSCLITGIIGLLKFWFTSCCTRFLLIFRFSLCSTMRNCGINPLLLGWNAWCSVLQTRISVGATFVKSMTVRWWYSLLGVLSMTLHGRCTWH
jgi:hypothetical protein